MADYSIYLFERNDIVKIGRLFGTLLCIFVILFCSFFSLNAFAAQENALVITANPENSCAFEVTLDGKESMEDSNLVVKKGAKVVIKAVAMENYVFDHWVIGGLPAADVEDQLQKEEISFTMPEEKVSAEACFKKNGNAFTVTVERSDYGRGDFGYKDFEPGQTVAVQAIAYDGYKFSHWIDLTRALGNAGLPEDWEKNSIVTFTMPSREVVLEPVFEPITYYLTLEIVGTGDAIVVGKEKNDAGKYECTIGESLSLAAMPGKDFVFVNWSATNSAQLLDYDLKDAAVLCPASDFTVTATFASAIRTLTVKTTEGGTVIPEPGEREVGVGNIVSLIATPNDGYMFSHWECSSKAGTFESAEDSDTSFSMPEENCTVTAVFIKGGYRLTIEASAGGEVIGKEGTYEMGDKVSLEAKALEGYVFSYWKCSVNGAVTLPRSTESEIVIPGEDVKVTAVFVLKASLDPEETTPSVEEENGFPWVILVVIFVVSAAAITLVILREQMNLSYRYLVGKWYESIKNKLKKQ